ncbi:MAG: hypothetical protein FWE90_08520 [Defluviitaleaceae bacterium]|nr:hypothetical protein [Defluviitaleaceae bacterium]
MIEQHYYTREKRGYGTIARSPNLPDNIVKNDILPYCVYSAGEGGKCLTVVHYPDGRMLLGQAVHIPRAFFQHNLIIPAKMVNAILAAGFTGVRFETGYDAKQGETLLALEELPIDAYANGTESDGSYDLTDYDFSLLIRCLTLSAAKNKKTYIHTPIVKELADTHTFALAFLTGLYPRLPEELRHVLGFCTRSRDPLDKKGIHLIFTDNPRLKGDFLIDFTGKTGIINDVGDEKEYSAARYEAMPTKKFCERVFGEIDFWLAREPRIVRAKSFRRTIKTRMAQILESDGILPEAFIRRGKSGKYSEIIGFKPSDFIKADILRQVSLSQHNAEELRYIIGSYRLTPTKREKILHIIKSEGSKHGTPP